MSAQALQPLFDDFALQHAKGEAQLVMTALVGDLETPVSAFIKLRSAFSWNQ